MSCKHAGFPGQDTSACIPRVSGRNTRGTIRRVLQLGLRDAIIAAISSTNHCFPKREVGEDRRNNPLFQLHSVIYRRGIHHSFCIYLDLQKKSGMYHGRCGQCSWLEVRSDLRMESATFLLRILNLEPLVSNRSSRNLSRSVSTFYYSGVLR